MVQHEKVSIEQTIAAVIHGLENMGQRTFLHQRNQFYDKDSYATAKFFWNFNYTFVSYFLNHIHNRQSFQ